MIKKTMRSAWLGIVLLFMYLPVMILAVYSFTDTATIGTHGNFSLQNYKTLFTTGELLGMIGGLWKQQGCTGAADDASLPGYGTGKRRRL